jgi:NTE family protein
MVRRAKLGIALGGGGARGIAHIGVLKVLERENIFPDFITGTSIGALVGAAYAANPRISDLEKRVLEVLAPDSPNKIPLQNLDWVNWQESLKSNWISRLTRSMHKEVFLLLAFLRQAVLSVDDLRACVEAFLTDIDITETAIPFAAVATDLITGRQVVLSEGPIITAVMASCAVPGFMPPVHLNGRVLVDGGIVNTLPADVARAQGARVVVGVDAGMTLSTPFQIEDGIDVINRCTEIMSIRLGEINRKNCDLIIQLDNGAVSWLHFQDCAKLIQEGQKAAEKMIKQIKEAVAPPFYRRLLHPLGQRPAEIRRAPRQL